jgi:glycosyltransferase involved in cell wall biosynthesis
MGKVLSGPGIYARNIVDELTHDGHYVIVVSLKDQEPKEHGKYRFVGVDRPRFANNQARWLALSQSFARALWSLEQELKFDLIHFTDARDAFFCRTHAPRIGNVNDTYSYDIKPIIYYCKNYYDGLVRWCYYQFTHFFERMCLPKLDLVIANSQYTTRIIKKNYPEISSKVFLIYKSIHASHFQEILNIRRQDQNRQRNQILLIGSNLQRKGIRYLINAAPAIISEFPGMRFMIAGGDPAIPRLVQLSRQVCGGDYFNFLGNQDRESINQLYSDACIFVLPALVEALGIVLLEAMASGVPVIGTNTGGIPEIISNDLNGKLVPSENSAALSEAIVSVIKDKDLQANFIQAGLKTAKEFSVRKMMSETYAVYDHILRI